jgi:hypothetical protein
MELIRNQWILLGVVVCCVIKIIGGFRATLKRLILVTHFIFLNKFEKIISKKCPVQDSTKVNKFLY